MSLSASRAVLRQSTKLTGRSARRFESTTSKASEAAKNTASKANEAAKDSATKAKEVASNFQSKASEGLSKVSSSAGPAIAGYAKGVGNALGKVGGRTGKLIAFIERGIPPTIYYTRVAIELSKLVFKGQKMNPPPVSTFQAYFQRVIKSVRNPQALFETAQESTAKANPESILQRVRNLSTAQYVSGGVVAAELLGFFTVGEIIGRRKLVGYKSADGHH